MTRVSTLLAAALAACVACKEKSAGEGEGARAGEVQKSAAKAPSGPERVVLGRVEVSATRPERDAGVQAQALVYDLGNTLVESGHFFRTAADVPEGMRSRRADLEVALQYDVVTEGSHGGPAMVAAVDAELAWADGSDALTVRESVLAEQALEEGEEATDQMLADHVARAVGSLGPGLVAKEKLRGAPAKELIAALEGPDIDLALWALEVIGERKIEAALDPVLDLLASADPRLRDGAIGAAVALGDPRAVDPLAKQADFSDYDHLRTILEAVTAIGGDDAIEFLEFVASGHPDDGIKKRAAEGIERIKKRQGR